MRTVKNILDSKQKIFNIVSPDTLVIDALSMMNTVNLSYVVVLDNGDYKGIFSERDHIRNVILKGLSSDTTQVKDVMTSDLPMVVLSDTVEHCMKTMILHKSRYLLAFEADKKFAGVVTIHDLLREVINNKQGVFDHAAKKLLDHDEHGYVY